MSSNRLGGYHQGRRLLLPPSTFKKNVGFEALISVSQEGFRERTVLDLEPIKKNTHTHRMDERKQCGR